MIMLMHASHNSEICDERPYLFYDHFGCLAYGLHDLPPRPAHTHLTRGQSPQPCTWGRTGHRPRARQPRQGAGAKKVVGFVE